MSGVSARRPLVRLGAAAVLLTLVPAVAPANAAEPTARDRTYHNPLAPTVPGDGTVDSCADPTVLRGQQPGDPYWYMYCTSDPLNDAEVTGPDEAVFHRVPMMRSRNLVDWRYMGDAFSAPPEWAADTASLWAPDVVYSQATDRYYLTFVVTDVGDAVSGEPGCADDNAIGVAVSRGPLGPWHVADGPVVGPRRSPDGGGTGCDPGDFLWTYDPDVLGDTVGRSGVLYYGSYFGGVHATHVAFDAQGITTTGEPRRIVIGNRYEGTNVVRRGDWYYYFGSATNCCNGPLTGYSVFAGRSRSPFGPFVDRDGDSLLAGRVGGTPVISMNGNRWVGTGHNTVFRDFDGQWWTVYHAVDRKDPYFTADPGFTKRPALLDPIDWVDGWPTVRAGRWASNRPMPAPAAQPGQVSGYEPVPVAPQRPGVLLDGPSDEFEAPLGARWSWVREPAADAYAVEDGHLRFDTQAGDLSTDTDDAPVLTTPAPRRDYVVQTKLRLDVPPEGDGYNFVQAGLVLYAGDDRFTKLTHASLWETRQTEFAKEVASPPTEFPQYGNTVVGAPGRITLLRIVREADTYTAYTRHPDGDWVRGGTWVHHLGDGARIGLVSMGGTGFTAEFDHLRVWTLQPTGH